jgi:hypothetical protein
MIRGDGCWIYHFDDIEVREYPGDNYLATKGTRSVRISTVLDALDEVGNNTVQRIRVRVYDGDVLTRCDSLTRKNPARCLGVEGALEIAKRYL